MCFEPIIFRSVQFGWRFFDRASDRCVAHHHRVREDGRGPQRDLRYPTGNPHHVTIGYFRKCSAKIDFQSVV